MVEKESGRLVDVEFPSLWAEDTIQVASNYKMFVLPTTFYAFILLTFTFRYLNTVTHHRQLREPKLCLGGILADVSAKNSMPICWI